EDRRSISRGRDFTSSGRGGAGNIRRNPDLPEVPATITRGREPVPNYSARSSVSVGRGGAGNIRSPSRDPAQQTDAAYEQEVIRRRMEERQAAVVSSGRGGAGNFTSPSRSRSRDPYATPTTSDRSRSRDARHSTGRGGAGNIRPGDGGGIESEVIEEEERRGVGGARTDGVHSTGRGGLANLTALPFPAPEHHQHHDDVESTGRGGRGNI
ncbi:hypothetical protein NEOLEDRAFT_1033158, partial [Neolentinus lepideus HHB14362 ss-1]